MTFIDEVGKTCLAAMHRQGAESVAATADERHRGRDLSRSV